MKIFKGMSKLVAAGALALTAGAAQADLMVGGVTWNPDAPFIDFTAQSDLYETNVNQVGDTLYGIGVVTGMNGTGAGVFCPSCQLTFEFGYTVSAVGDFDSNGEINVIFDNGYVNFWVQDTSAGDYTAFNFLDASSAVDGDLWLSLTGHTDFDPITGQTGQLFGELDPGFALSDFNEEGGGSGLLDVSGGLAALNFDTNTLDDFFAEDVADFNFTSEFQPFPQGGTTPDGFALAGTGTLVGNSVPVPGTLALLGLGLIGLGALRRKRAIA